MDPADLITVTIDGVEVNVPKGTLIIRAAEMIGHPVPRFCDHPLLDPVGACRQCLVEISDDGRGRPMPKPQASCTTTVMPGQVIKTQMTSPVAAKAQNGINEFLLINHPLDCPICDKGGECPLQNQAVMVGNADTRFNDVKRTYPKPIPISTEILLDRDRCVLCSRCTRFADQIAGDAFIDLAERGAVEQVAIYREQPFNSYFSGNVIQICPVGALTSTAYRFRARPFDLVSTMTTCEHCAAGCELRVDHRRNEVMRRYAGDDPDVNEEWNCDKGRFAFVSGRGDDRLTHPLIREDGVLRPASWPEAVNAAVEGLRAAGRNVGLLPGGRVTLEDAYAWSKFARVALGTNNVDFRSRPHSAEEAGFLAHAVAGRSLQESVTYTDLEKASGVLLVGFEPEDESPIVFLRLRKAWRKKKLRVFTVAPFLSNGSVKLGATLVPTVPGGEAARLDGLGDEVDLGGAGVILVGERAGADAGTLSAVLGLAERTGARIAWIPRRAGERGALEAGLLPNLLPGGRPADAAEALVDVRAAWEIDELPTQAGLDADAILAAAAEGRIQALVIGGVEPTDFRNPAAARLGLENAGFVISLEQRLSEVTARADVVFPVSLFEERRGTFLNWEGRERPIAQVVSPRTVVDDLRILVALADGLGADLGIPDADAAWAELDQLGRWEGQRAAAPATTAAPAPTAQEGDVVLATWRTLLDAGRGQDGEPYLAGTGPLPVARVSAATAERIGAGETVALQAGGAELRYPLVVEASMVDDVVWVPRNAPGLSPAEALGVGAGDRVRLLADSIARSDDSTGGMA
ncbi:NADH-quinone oxidoreductase subunit G [Raineyella fluvialis]|uniref:NADH-quinone oxidoreductase n=2 Tax=Raineyella fluvialis TaxID=2662261 RepID=A0A5Q2FF65_9ACTN|nr:NADH-quinone oxidoreductase subunit G [Raineyella fluvialis]QGF25051.1 NADH-quinone oxidoreductase subunit G [Raineyella fluvialis]